MCCAESQQWFSDFIEHLTLIIAYSLIVIYANETPHLILTALSLSPTATTTSTNIHLFYYVFLMEHINCLCCCLACYSLLFIFRYLLLYFNILIFFGNAVLQLHTNVFT